MTEAQPDWDRPLPKPDGVTAEFWRAAADGRLLIQRCPACGHRQFYPRAVCTSCGETPAWEQAAGRGVVHTFTVIRQNHAPPFKDLLPYVVAMVQLDEGPLMMGNVVDCDPEEVRVGAPVEVTMRQAAPEVGVPFWRLVR